MKNKNEITGDRLVSRSNTKAFDENFDKIFQSKCPRCQGWDAPHNNPHSDFIYVCPLCENTGSAAVI